MTNHEQPRPSRKALEQLALKWRNPDKTEPLHLPEHQRWRRRQQRRRTQRIWKDNHWYHPNATHGTTTGYKVFGCRCTDCRNYEATRRKANHARRRKREREQTT